MSDIETGEAKQLKPENQSSSKTDDCQNAKATGCSLKIDTYTGNEMTETFDEMNLRHPLLRGIYAYGFELPTPVQQRAILPGLSGRDVIVQAQSGTGKTATYTVPILQRLDETRQECQALILAPTRELAHGISRVVLALGEYIHVTCHVCTGGSNVGDDIERLKSGVQIVVGTPVRVLDMLKRSALQIDNMKMCVLDDVDDILSSGLLEQIRDIFMVVAKDAQMLFFSSTMPAEALEITKLFMNNPVTVLVKSEEYRLEGIRQFYVDVKREEDKVDVLCNLYEMASTSKIVVYCKTRRAVDSLTEEMRSRNISVLSTSGDMEKKERDTITQEFLAGRERMLVATELFARSTDNLHVNVIINYGLPSRLETYTHRIGYSGRFCPRYTVISFVTAEDLPVLRVIEQHYGTQIQALPTDITDLV